MKEVFRDDHRKEWSNADEYTKEKADPHRKARRIDSRQAKGILPFLHHCGNILCDIHRLDEGKQRHHELPPGQLRDAHRPRPDERPVRDLRLRQHNAGQRDLRKGGGDSL